MIKKPWKPDIVTIENFLLKTCPRSGVYYAWGRIKDYLRTEKEESMASFGPVTYTDYSKEGVKLNDIRENNFFEHQDDIYRSKGVSSNIDYIVSENHKTCEVINISRGMIVKPVRLECKIIYIN